MSDELTPDEVSDALASSVDPERLEAYEFAERILPAFELVRSLFSRNPLDTCLKLMVLYELSRARGRFTRQRLRIQAGFLEPEHVDALVDSLRKGGWLELRAVDNTYRLSPRGLHLLAILHATDLGSVSPANALSRAAQNAAFGATLDGAQGTTTYLLENLLSLLENQVEGAQNMLQRGRPFELIQWSRREHTRQLQIIRQVLAKLQETIDETSQEFTRINRLHKAMQDIIRAHTGINARLRDWNVRRLYSTERGYSIEQLIEAVLGIDDATLVQVLEEEIVQVPQLPPSLSTAEIKTRFHAARRKLPSQKESYVYEAPEALDARQWESKYRDPTEMLRRRLTEAMAGRSTDDEALELDDWIEADDFAGVVFELAGLSRLQYGEEYLELMDGRRVKVALFTDRGEEVTPGEMLNYLVEVGALRRLESGWFPRIRLRLVDDNVKAPDSSSGGEGENG